MRSAAVVALFAAGVAVAGVVSPARAAGPAQGCASAPESQWRSIDQLKSDVAAQGFVVWKGRISNSCAEIAAYPSSTGALERLLVDPATGRIVEVR
jgi:hypothetical protein